VAEQADALSSIATTSTKQSAGVATIARISGEQAVASEQIAAAVTLMRTNAKDLVGAIGQHTKTINANTADVGAVASGLARLRTSTAQQAEAVDSLTTTLNTLREGGASSSPVSESA
jgi:hypothetical protein